MAPLTISTKQGIIVALVVYFAVGYLNEFVVENTVWHDIRRPPLYDRGHHLIPHVRARWPNLLLVALVAYFVLRWGWRHPKMLENYLWIIALLFIGRVLAFSVTQVPPPRQGCSTREKGDPLRIVPFIGHWKECEDQMYSGHTIHVVLIALFVLYARCSVAEKATVAVLAAAELVMVVGGRLHYTADVVIGALVAVLAFFAWPGVDRAVANMQHGGVLGRRLAAAGSGGWR